jgi:hypothetical protein
MKRIALSIPVLLTLLATSPAGARNIEQWSYEELFAKSDFVVIAVPASKTRDTKERNVLTYNISPGVDVLGVSTAFESLLVIKGPKRKKFVLHHYRLAPGDGGTGVERVILNGPGLVSFDPEPVPQPFLMFLVRERDGRLAPVANQTDLSTSVQKLPL